MNVAHKRAQPEDVPFTMGVVCGVVAAFVLVCMLLLARCTLETPAIPKVVKPLQAWTFEDHKWVTFTGGGLYHHPDCPCNSAPKDEGGGL